MSTASCNFAELLACSCRLVNLFKNDSFVSVGATNSSCCNLWKPPSDIASCFKDSISEVIASLALYFKRVDIKL